MITLHIQHKILAVPNNTALESGNSDMVLFDNDLALKIARTIPSVFTKAVALRDIVQHLLTYREQLHPRPLNRALEIAHTIPQVSTKADALKIIIKHLAKHPDQLDRALEIVGAIPDDTERDTALKAIVNYLLKHRFSEKRIITPQQINAVREIAGTIITDASELALLLEKLVVTES